MMRNQIIHADCRHGLREFPDNSIDCCITSPPYWGKRDYGHADQIGKEPNPWDYLATMVQLFTEVYRVLAPHGTLWLNLGDTYASKGAKRLPVNTFNKSTIQPGQKRFNNLNTMATLAEGLKAKDMVGIPWLVALSLRAAGWYLRDDIIWAKPNPMRESVKDRTTKAHEYLFLLTKNPVYYFDHEAIKVPTKDSTKGRVLQNLTDQRLKQKSNGPMKAIDTGGMAHKTSVWEVSTKSFKEAHFAVYPPDLITDCVKAGTSEHGYCDQCGKPYIRQIEKVSPIMDREIKLTSKFSDKSTAGRLKQVRDAARKAGGEYSNQVRTTGWKVACKCGGGGTARPYTRSLHGRWHDGARGGSIGPGLYWLRA